MDVFSRSESDVGYYSGYEARVSLRCDIKDIIVKFNPFPAAIRPKVRSILRRYHDLGIISFAGEDNKDPIVSNLVVVKKSDLPGKKKKKVALYKEIPRKKVPQHARTKESEGFYGRGERGPEF